MFLEECNRPPQNGVVQIVSEIGNHAKPCVVHKVGSGIVAHRFNQRRDNQRISHNNPRIVEVARNKEVEIQFPRYVRNVKHQHIVCNSIRPQHIVEDRLHQQDAESFEQPYHRHQHDGREQLQPIRPHVM